MSTLKPVRLIAILLLSLVGALAKTRPNIIVITADDMGLETNAYGKNYIPTPQMDRLAKMGVIFDHAYVTQSSCSSSRASLFTGLYPHQSGQWGLEHYGFRVKNGVEILPNLLVKNGYRTAIIGKLHVGCKTPFQITALEEDIDSTRWMRRTRYVKRVSERVSDFLKKSTDQPAFIKVSYLDPHRPWDKQVEGIPAKPMTFKETPLVSYNPKQTYLHGVRVQSNGYLNNMMRLDVGIGMLLDQLEADDLLDNTVIIFFGDNGPPLERAKGTCWDAGTRIPMFVAWPQGGIPQNIRTNAIVSTVDLFATILDLAGVGQIKGIPSRSLLPLLKKPGSEFRQFAFTEMNFHGIDAYRPWRTVQDRSYKLHYTYDLEGRREEKLFHVESDPLEQKNLVDDPQHSKVLQKLRAQLNEWQIETNDPFRFPAFLKDFSTLGLPKDQFDPKTMRIPPNSPVVTAPSDDQTYGEWFMENKLPK